MAPLSDSPMAAGATYGQHVLQRNQRVVPWEGGDRCQAWRGEKSHQGDTGRDDGRAQCFIGLGHPDALSWVGP